MSERKRLSDAYQTDLVARIIAGDIRAESELVATFERPLYSMLLNRVRDAEAARDLVQDVFVAALPALRRRQLAEPSRLAAFLHGIAKNIAGDFRRRALRRPPHVEVGAEDAWLDARQHVEVTARLREVERALAELSPDDREMLVQTLVEGRKPAEVAARMGLSAEVVRTRKTRALKRLIERVSGRVTNVSL